MDLSNQVIDGEEAFNTSAKRMTFFKEIYSEITIFFTNTIGTRVPLELEEAFHEFINEKSTLLDRYIEEIRKKLKKILRVIENIIVTSKTKYSVDEGKALQKTLNEISMKLISFREYCVIREISFPYLMSFDNFYDIKMFFLHVKIIIEMIYAHTFDEEIEDIEKRESIIRLDNLIAELTKTYASDTPTRKLPNNIVATVTSTLDDITQLYKSLPFKGGEDATNLTMAKVQLKRFLANIATASNSSQKLDKIIIANVGRIISPLWNKT
jgi:hypothetical protein